MMSRSLEGVEPFPRPTPTDETSSVVGESGAASSSKKKLEKSPVEWADLPIPKDSA